MDIVEDIMTKEVFTCNPKTDILEVKYLMSKHLITRVVVVNAKNKPVGIITQKDIVKFLLTDKSKRELDRIHAEEVMSKDLVTVKPIVPVIDIAKTMVTKKISSLVVVDEENRLKGIATKADLTLYLASKGDGIFRVKEFMTPKPITINPKQSIFSATSLMSENEISRMIVTDEQNKIVGILTMTDAVPMLIVLPKLRYLTVKDSMTANPISINKNADLADAAKLMITHGISGLPVKDNFGDLVGIVTKSDLIRAIASIRD